jgi:chromosome segregation ATPase
MAIGVFVVVLLMVYLGWEIVDIERKRAQNDADRRLLERDRLAYTKILEELPGLEDRRHGILREISELEGKAQSIRTAFENLTTQSDIARSDLDKAKASSSAAEESEKAARESLANLQGEIQTRRPELQSLEQKVKTLTEEEKTSGLKETNCCKRLQSSTPSLTDWSSRSR